MSEANVYHVGDLVRVATIFKNQAGTATDPSVVRFKIKNGAGPTTEYIYGTHAQLVKDSTGNYHVDVDASAKGNWYWRWFSTGTGQAADEGYFRVDESYF